jgi:hypothetical protein
MNNDELLKMYAAIKSNPGEIVREAARHRLINFARYMQPDLTLEPFHVVYYTLLDKFAHGEMKKNDCANAATTRKIGGVKPQITRIYVGIEPGHKNLHWFVCRNNCKGF